MRAMRALRHTLVAVVLVALAAVSAVGQPRTAFPDKRGFKLSDFPRFVTLAENVYGYEEIRDPGFTTVSLVVVGTGGVLIVDGQGSVSATQTLLDRINKITPNRCGGTWWIGPRRPHRRQLGTAEGCDLRHPSDLAGADGARRGDGDGAEPQGGR